jgi:hypothetical protein
LKLPTIEVGGSGILAVAVLVILGVGAWTIKAKIEEEGGTVADAFNPLSPNNLANRTFEKVIGGSLWDVLRPDQAHDDQVTPLPILRRPAVSAGGVFLPQLSDLQIP